jgi:hypothetical protein
MTTVVAVAIVVEEAILAAVAVTVVEPVAVGKHGNGSLF